MAKYNESAICRELDNMTASRLDAGLLNDIIKQINARLNSFFSNKVGEGLVRSVIKCGLKYNHMLLMEMVPDILSKVISDLDINNYKDLIKPLFKHHHFLILSNLLFLGSHNTDNNIRMDLRDEIRLCNGLIKSCEMHAQMPDIRGVIITKDQAFNRRLECKDRLSTIEDPGMFAMTVNSQAEQHVPLILSYFNIMNTGLDEKKNNPSDDIIERLAEASATADDECFSKLVHGFSAALSGSIEEEKNDGVIEAAASGEDNVAVHDVLQDIVNAVAATDDDEIEADVFAVLQGMVSQVSDAAEADESKIEHLPNWTISGGGEVAVQGGKLVRLGNK